MKKIIISFLVISILLISFASNLFIKVEGAETDSDVRYNITDFVVNSERQSIQIVGWAVISGAHFTNPTYQLEFIPTDGGEELVSIRSVDSFDFSNYSQIKKYTKCLSESGCGVVLHHDVTCELFTDTSSIDTGESYTTTDCRTSKATSIDAGSYVDVANTSNPWDENFKYTNAGFYFEIPVASLDLLNSEYNIQLHIKSDIGEQATVELQIFESAIRNEGPVNINGSVVNIGTNSTDEFTMLQDPFDPKGSFNYVRAGGKEDGRVKCESFNGMAGLETNGVSPYTDFINCNSAVGISKSDWVSLVNEKEEEIYDMETGDIRDNLIDSFESSCAIDVNSDTCKYLITGSIGEVSKNEAYNQLRESLENFQFGLDLYCKSNSGDGDCIDYKSVDIDGLIGLVRLKKELTETNETGINLVIDIFEAAGGTSYSEKERLEMAASARDSLDIIMMEDTSSPLSNASIYWKYLEGDPYQIIGSHKESNSFVGTNQNLGSGGGVAKVDGTSSSNFNFNWGDGTSSPFHIPLMMYPLGYDSIAIATKSGISRIVIGPYPYGETSFNASNPNLYAYEVWGIVGSNDDTDSFVITVDGNQNVNDVSGCVGDDWVSTITYDIASIPNLLADGKYNEILTLDYMSGAGSTIGVNINDIIIDDPKYSSVTFIKDVGEIYEEDRKHKVAVSIEFKNLDLTSGEAFDWTFDIEVDYQNHATCNSGVCVDPLNPLKSCNCNSALTDTIWSTDEGYCDYLGTDLIDMGASFKTKVSIDDFNGYSNAPVESNSACDIYAKEDIQIDYPSIPSVLAGQSFSYDVKLLSKKSLITLYKTDDWIKEYNDLMDRKEELEFDIGIYEKALEDFDDDAKDTVCPNTEIVTEETLIDYDDYYYNEPGDNCLPLPADKFAEYCGARIKNIMRDALDQLIVIHTPFSTSQI